MAWLLLIVALGLAVGLLIITFGYRTSMLILLGVLLIALVGIVWYAEFYESPKSNRISTDQVRLDSFGVRATHGNSYELTARLRNDSTEHDLTAVGIQISASDCAPGNGERSCVVVGQETSELRHDVPAGQARDIKHPFIFPEIRPQGDIEWDYSILYTEAAR